jgi:hypothetical protein
MSITTVNFDQDTFSVTTSAQQLLDYKNDRTYLLIQNNGAGTVYINFSGDATTENGIKIDAEEAYEPSAVPSNAISIIGDASADVIVVEG